MADVLSILGAIAALTQGFEYGYSTVLRKDRNGNNPMLRDYAVHMHILRFCGGVIQDCTHEDPLSTAILETAKQCAEIGVELTERDQKERVARKQTRFALTSSDKLEALYKDFITNVSLLHQLVQRSVCRNTTIRSPNIETDRSHFSFLIQRVQCRLTEVPTIAQQIRVWQNWESTAAEASSFTIGSQSTAEVMTLAEEVVARSVARGVHFDPDPSLVLGTVVIVHESKPRFVPVRAKYDTGSDANFIPYELIKNNGLLEFLVKLEVDSLEDNVFIGLNDQEYTIEYTIELQWSAATMRHVRTTQFHVAEDLPYDLVLGNPFIQANQVFHPQRVALPLHHKHPNPSESSKKPEL